MTIFKRPASVDYQKPAGTYIGHQHVKHGKTVLRCSRTLMAERTVPGYLVIICLSGSTISS